MTIAGATETVPAAAGEPLQVHILPDPVAAPFSEAAADGIPVDLVRLAWARSGDKGHLFNVAVIARKPEYLPWIAAALSAEAISEWYRHLGTDGQPPRVDRYEAPGLHALNFVLHDALVGGINASTRLDPAAKGMAQMLLRFPVRVPAELAASIDQTATTHERH
jgi:hypothetical protein